MLVPVPPVLSLLWIIALPICACQAQVSQPRCLAITYTVFQSCDDWLCVYVCVCVCVFVSACVCLCECECVYVGMHVCVHVWGVCARMCMFVKGPLIGNVTVWFWAAVDGHVSKWISDVTQLSAGQWCIGMEYKGLKGQTVSWTLGPFHMACYSSG